MKSSTPQPCRVSLDVIEVASPCPAQWADMQGDERVRLCRDCNLHVYNLSDMTRADAEALLSQRVGRTCIRFFRRADGTVLTQDCPRGLRLARRSLAFVASSLLITVGLLSSVLWWSSQTVELSQDIDDGPLAKLAQWVDPPGGWTMGF